jgi:hypothetical protein
MKCRLDIPQKLWNELQAHLFPGDGDEHAAVLAASVVEVRGTLRLLARRLIKAIDGEDYIEGRHSYRTLKAQFITQRVIECRDERMAYLPIHCHPGRNSVAFSRIDMASHERGYPALLDILNGMPVGALVFAENAAAGDIWLPDGRRLQLDSVRIVGRPIRHLYASPRHARGESDDTYDRQVRLFGDVGQALLRHSRIGLIGAGGVGSIVAELLIRLGVGELVVVDPDRIERPNLNRIPFSTEADVDSTYKVDHVKRYAELAGNKTRVEAYAESIVKDDVARRLLDCDFIFLAADSNQARLVFNTLVHQYLIPGYQIGSKVSIDKATGDITDVFSVVRPVYPGETCLWCANLIDRSRLQEESLSEHERRANQYVDDPTIIAPSVITLNSIGASHAVNDFLFSYTGLMQGNGTSESNDIGTDALYVHPITSRFRYEEWPGEIDCPKCSIAGEQLGSGNLRDLPTALST